MKLSIVMVNWNRFDDLSYSIDKIGSLNSDWEFVIVDNGSGHDVNSNPYEIYENRKNFNVIRLDRNVGCESGNNIGYLNCRGEYILTLDSDAWIDRDNILQLIKVMETDERIGVIEPRVILTRSGEIQNEPQNWPLQNIFIGCAFLSRRSALLSIGLRPSEYFLYGSELDISIKLLKKNWKVMHCSDITAMHSEAEAMRSSAMLVELFCRNNLWNIVRHYSGWNIVYQLSFHVVFSAYLGLRNRRYLAFLKGLVRGFVGLKKNAIDQRKVDWDQDTCLLYPPTRILMRVLKNRILS